jgi:hypothetical protein
MDDGGFRAAIARAFVEYENLHGPLGTVHHTLQVTSFGGSGSTALSERLAAVGVNIPKTPGEYPFKHQRVPPKASDVPPSFRVLYPYADPRNAMLSIFRRGFIVDHYVALRGMQPTPEVAQRLSSLDAFLEGGVDDFALEDHVEHWIQPLEYPVMFVRYESLPQAWPRVREFVGLPDDVECLPMRPRACDWMELPLHEQRRLEGIYGSLADRLDALPDVFVPQSAA